MFETFIAVTDRIVQVSWRLVVILLLLVVICILVAFVWAAVCALVTQTKKRVREWKEK